MVGSLTTCKQKQNRGKINKYKKITFEYTVLWLAMNAGGYRYWVLSVV